VAPKSGQREILIETLFKEKSNGVLVSPSLMEGLSLNDDMCRLQIVIKVPFTTLSDKRIKIRASTNPTWYSQEAIFKIVQSSGRGVRHKDDYCITFILDSAFQRLLNMHKKIFPFWFLKAVESIKVDDIIPTLRKFSNERLLNEVKIVQKRIPTFDDYDILLPF
jgi:Rad3-related DNA helicase